MSRVQWRANGESMFGWRKRIGYIAPTVIEVVAYEFYQFAPDGIGLTGVTCNIDDWRPDEFDKALAQVASAATYLGSRGVDFIIHGGGPLVVARGPGHKRDLQIVRPYIRDFKPVLVAVDGGADALLEAGYKPHVIVGDMDSVSDRALRSGAELLIHAYHGGEAPGAERADRLGLAYEIVPATGISEDVALLLAYEKGAELIVAVGTHFNMIEFLERNRAGMSSTFLTRLKVGELLIDARGVSRLVSRQVGVWPLLAFTAAGLGAIAAAVLVSPDLRELIDLLGSRLLELVGIR